MLLGRIRSPTGATGHTADDFAAFFARKVDDVMDATAGQPPPTVEAVHYLDVVAKSCIQDPIWTFLCRGFVDLLLPYTPSIVNTSLHQGRLPVVVPVLKKPGLDTADMANFRPVSNVTFTSEVTERAVARQLHAASRQHSTVSIMCCSYADCSTISASQMTCYAG